MLVDCRSALEEQRRVRGGRRLFLARWLIGLDKDYLPSEKADWQGFHPAHAMLGMLAIASFRALCPRTAATATEFFYK